MILEVFARAGCCRALYLLKLDGRRWGAYRWEYRWLGRLGHADIRLRGRRKLRLELLGLESRFALIDAADGRTLAEASAGVTRNRWELRLSNGPARTSADWNKTPLRVVQGNRAVALADFKPGLWRGWAVTNGGSIQDTDLLFIGLIYAYIGFCPGLV